VVPVFHKTATLFQNFSVPLLCQTIAKLFFLSELQLSVHLYKLCPASIHSLAGDARLVFNSCLPFIWYKLKPEFHKVLGILRFTQQSSLPCLKRAKFRKNTTASSGYVSMCTSVRICECNVGECMPAPTVFENNLTGIKE